MRRGSGSSLRNCFNKLATSCGLESSAIQLPSFSVLWGKVHCVISLNRYRVLIKFSNIWEPDLRGGWGKSVPVGHFLNPHAEGRRLRGDPRVMGTMGHGSIPYEERGVKKHNNFIAPILITKISL